MSWLFSILCGLTVYQVASGLHGRYWFGTDPLAQNVLLWHFVFGGLATLVGLLLCFTPYTRAARTGPDALPRPVRVVLVHTAYTVVLAGGAGLYLALYGAPLEGSVLRPTHSVLGYVSGVFLLALLVEFGRFGRLYRGPARMGRFLIGGLSLLVPLAVPWISSRSWQPPDHAIPFPETYWRASKPFLPSLAATAHGGAITVDGLSRSRFCGECHQDIYRQWLTSQHRFAADTPWYNAQVEYRMATSDPKGPAGARFCGACHEPVALFSGNMDDRGLGLAFASNKQEGVSCVGCHRITATRKGNVGNGSYVHEAHRAYLFEDGGGELQQSLNRSLIRGKPQVHASDQMRDLLTKSDFCASCHQVFFKTPRGRLHRIQTDFDDWRGSPFSDAADPAQRRRCQDCHMPRVPGEDPASRDGTVPSHRFTGAHTAHIAQRQDQEHLQLTEAMLRRTCSLTLDLPEQVEAGTELPVRVFITNLGAGHNFPGGTTDMAQAWLKLSLRDREGRTFHSSGKVDPKTLRVDPEAHFFRTVPVDYTGRKLTKKRDLWNIEKFEESRLIGPLKTAIEEYRIPVPAELRGTVSVEVELLFRRSHQEFTDYSFGRPSVQLPITRMARIDGRVRIGAPGSLSGAGD